MSLRMEKRMPLVSWLLPVHPTSDPLWLSQAIDSCVIGGIEDQEIVISLDGQVENSDTITLLSSWAEESNVKLLHNRLNRGVEYALNSAISVADGKYLARIDSDDTSLANRVARQVLFLEKWGLDACGGAVDAYDEQTRSSGLMRWPEFPTREEQRKILESRRVPISHPTCLFRASSIKALGENPYPMSYRHAEDMALWVRAWHHHWRLGSLQEPLVRYRMHAKSTCKEFGPEQYESTKRVLRDWEKLK
jgi:glycosyltransferase involved in cell wall biosynthesis